MFNKFGWFKKIFIVAATFFLMISLVSEAISQKGQDGFRRRKILTGSLRRTVDFYAPTSRGNNPPLVIAFHGTSGRSDEWIDKAPGSDPSGMEGLAAQHGFVIAAPQSRRWGEANCNDWDNHEGQDYYWETRCNGAENRGANPNGNADLILVRKIISLAQKTYNIDPQRVYLIGFSNGGFFATLAAMALPNQIAAFAEAGGGLVACIKTRTCWYRTDKNTYCSMILNSAPRSCTSCKGVEKPITIPTKGRKVPGFLAHNNNDDVVSVYYTCSLAKRMKELGYDTKVLITNESGHSFPEGFVVQAWKFFSTKKLP